jgi:hypothetical protein
MRVSRRFSPAKGKYICGLAKGLRQLASQWAFLQNMRRRSRIDASLRLSPAASICAVRVGAT